MSDKRKRKEGDDRSRVKALQKANETPEERKARRLAKKMKKAANQKIQDQGVTYFGYRDETNPFGDANLTKPFIWKKKYEKEISEGRDPRKMTKRDLRQKQEDLKDEIERVKQRRMAREMEQKQLEDMRELVQRELDAEAHRDWEQKEEEFHRETAKLRSQIRIKEGREKPIDILAKNLELFKSDMAPDPDLPLDLDIELTEPYKIFDGLSERDLKDLGRDLKEQVGLGEDLEFWKALSCVCNDEVLKMSHYKSGKTEKNRYGLQPAIQAEVVRMLEGKLKHELEDLHRQISKKLESAARGESREAVDMTYWDALLKQIEIYRAKALLKEMHQSLLRKRLRQLKEHNFKELHLGSERKHGGSSSPYSAAPLSPKLEAHSEEPAAAAAAAASGGGDGGVVIAPADWSPVLVRDEEIGDDVEIVDEEEDKALLEKQRRQVMEQKERAAEQVEEDERKQKEREEEMEMDKHAAGLGRFMMSTYEAEASRPLEDDEAKFSSEIAAVPDTPYWWHDKYRPRKPRYFNRVKTGFDWNKYNQTHYDRENPPPKIVQGYKFNIFYPDLIDMTKPPKYVMTPDVENPDYATIRFSGGPPYEDIAFKIVNKEWEYSHKRGFRCVFDRGVLQLHFNFRRYRYRR